MDSTSVVFTLVVAAGAVGVGWYFMRGPGMMPSTPTRTPPPSPPVDDLEEELEDDEPEKKPGEIERPNLEDPKIAAADELVRKWFVEKLGGPRGMDKAARDEAMGAFMRDQGLTPGLAAMAAYNQLCQKKKLSPKRPPAEVRAAMSTLGIKR